MATRAGSSHGGDDLGDIPMYRQVHGHRPAPGVHRCPAGHLSRVQHGHGSALVGAHGQASFPSLQADPARADRQACQVDVAAIGTDQPGALGQVEPAEDAAAVAVAIGIGSDSADRPAGGQRHVDVSAPGHDAGQAPTECEHVGAEHTAAMAVARTHDRDHPAPAGHVDRAGVVAAGDPDRAEPALGVACRVNLEVGPEVAAPDVDRSDVGHVDRAAGPARAHQARQGPAEGQVHVLADRFGGHAEPVTGLTCERQVDVVGHIAEGEDLGRAVNVDARADPLDTGQVQPVQAGLALAGQLTELDPPVAGLVGSGPVLAHVQGQTRAAVGAVQLDALQDIVVVKRERRISVASHEDRGDHVLVHVDPGPASRLGVGVIADEDGGPCEAAEIVGFVDLGVAEGHGVEPGVGRGAQPSVLGHLAHHVGAAPEAVEGIVAVRTGRGGRFLVVELAVPVDVQVDGPSRQARLALVLRAVRVEVVPLGAGDHGRSGLTVAEVDAVDDLARLDDHRVGSAPAVDRELLGEHAGPAPVLALGPPGRHRPTLGVHRHGREPLVQGGVGVDLELVPTRCAVGVVPLGVDAVSVAVLVAALPGDQEPAVGVHRCRRIPLERLGIRVDAELGARGRPVGMVRLGVHVIVAVVAVLAVAHPGDHDVAIRTHRDRRGGLVPVGEGVDLEFAAGRGPVGVEPLGEHTGVVAVLGVPVRAGAVPRDHEPTVPVHGHVGDHLRAGRVGVDGELVARGGAVRLEQARTDLAPATPLADAVPHDHETAGGAHRHLGTQLRVVRVGVHAELTTHGRAVRLVHLGADAPAGVVGPLPGDGKVAALVHGHRRVVLRARNGRVDLELAADSGSVGPVPLGKDPPAVLVLAVACPSDHEVAGRVGRHRWRVLVPVGVRVDLELVPGACACAGEGLLPPLLEHLAHHVGAGPEVLEAVVPTGVGRGVHLLGAEIPVPVGVQVDGPAFQTRLVLIPHAVAVEVVPFAPGDHTAVEVDEFERGHEVAARVAVARGQRVDRQRQGVVAFAVQRVARQVGHTRSHLHVEHHPCGVGGLRARRAPECAMVPVGRPILGHLARALVEAPVPDQPRFRPTERLVHACLDLIPGTSGVPDTHVGDGAVEHALVAVVGVQEIPNPQWGRPRVGRHAADRLGPFQNAVDVDLEGVPVVGRGDVVDVTGRV